MKIRATLMAMVVIAATTAPIAAEARAKKPVPTLQQKQKKIADKAALKSNVVAAKARATTGKAMLKQAKADLKSAARNERALRPQRERLLAQLNAAVLAQRANDNPQTQNAATAASNAYKPVQGQHEAALAQLQQNQRIVGRVQGQQRAAMNSLTIATKAARYKPLPGVRPRVAGNARSQSQPAGAAVAASSQVIYSPLPQLAPLNHGRLAAESAPAAGRPASPVIGRLPPPPPPSPIMGRLPPPPVSPVMGRLPPPPPAFALPPAPAGARQYDVVPPQQNGNYQLRRPIRQNIYEQPDSPLII